MKGASQDIPSWPQRSNPNANRRGERLCVRGVIGLQERRNVAPASVWRMAPSWSPPRWMSFSVLMLSTKPEITKNTLTLAVPA